MAEDTQQKIPAASATLVPKRRLPTGWRKWAYRLLSMTVVPVFLLLVLELVLRLCGYGYPANFFLPGVIDEREVFTNNPSFARRFFPPGISRETDAMVFAAAKAPGTYRIFILGESAAMGYPNVSFHFGRILQAMLQDRYPDTRFEIINTALTAINSHVILPISRDCVQHQPDLFIVYMGNNEVVGPYGPAGVLGPFASNLQMIRASVRVKATRTGQLLASLLHRATDAGKPSGAWGGMTVFVGNEVKADDPRLETVYGHFAHNLRDICGVGQQAGAKVVVCTVACNLKDSAPFASVAAAGLSAEQRESWQNIVAAGARLESAGDPALALVCYRRAALLDDKAADLHFRLGRCLAALKKQQEAHGHFVLARDLDALRFRADTSLNEIIRATANGRQDEGVYLADAERDFALASADGIPGEELFYEHVHLTFAGNYRLAHTVLEQIVRILPDSMRPHGNPDAPFLSVAECKERLAFTEWNQKSSLMQVADLASKPPFINQLDHAERQARWRRRLDQLNARLKAGGGREAVAVYRRALARDPGDYYLHKNFVPLLVEQGELAEAVQHLREAMKVMPHDAALHCWRAEILENQGKLDEALAAARESVKLAPNNASYHSLMGRLLLMAGKLDQAAAAATQAVKLAPDTAGLHVNLGVVFLHQKQHERAIAEFNEALRLDPDLINARQFLSRLFAGQGRTELAKHQLQEVLRIDPKHAASQVELAEILANEGRIAEAIAHLEEALRVRPNWPEVERALQELRLQDKKGR